MRRLPEAILLDLDDTILDDSSGIEDCWREACLSQHALMNGLDPHVVFEAIEGIRDWYWSDAERHRCGRLDLARARCEVVDLALRAIGVDNDELANGIGGRYQALRDERIRPFDDAVATVSWLRETGCRLALITNGSGAAQRQKIQRFGLDSLFDSVLIEGEVGFGKPDPRIYTHALAVLGANPRDTWMVGDNLEWDVAGPQREGIIGIWIDARGQGVPPHRDVRPDRVIRKLSELKDV